MIDSDRGGEVMSGSVRRGCFAVLSLFAWSSIAATSCAEAPDFKVDASAPDGGLGTDGAMRDPPDTGWDDAQAPDVSEVDAAMDAGVPARTATVSFQPLPGVAPYGSEVRLTSDDFAATIYYTLDGSEPTEDALVYRGPLVLFRHGDITTIKAMAIAPEKMPSPVRTAEYAREPGVTIHFKKPTEWSQAYVHYWSTVPDALETSWPGAPMLAEGDDWYRLTLPHQTSVNVVFNDSGQSQTADLHLEAPEGWYWDGDWWDVHPDRLDRFTYPQGKLKALVMSYDDGNVQDRGLVEIFNRRGVRGTFHLNSGKLGQPSYLSSDEVAVLFSGHEVSVHSVSHPFLTTLTDEQIRAEILDDKDALSQLVGYSVRGMSYPFGDYDRRTVEMLPDLGIEYARVVPVTNDFRLPGNLLEWRGSCHHGCAWDLANDFATRSPSRMELLFIWGHSWELDRGEPRNSWQYLEDLCALLGGRSDVWYATAIELADYLRALREVEMSPHDDAATNHSEITVWMKVGGQPVEMMPGATLRL